MVIQTSTAVYFEKQGLNIALYTALSIRSCEVSGYPPGRHPGFMSTYACLAATQRDDTHS